MTKKSKYKVSCVYSNTHTHTLKATKLLCNDVIKTLVTCLHTDRNRADKTDPFFLQCSIISVFTHLFMISTFGSFSVEMKVTRVLYRGLNNAFIISSLLVIR